MVPTDELHITRRTNNCIVLNNVEGRFSIEGIRAGRSKKDEQWHRWASVSESEKPSLIKPETASKPTVIGKFHTPIGHATISGMIVTRPSTGQIFVYGDLFYAQDAA